MNITYLQKKNIFLSPSISSFLSSFSHSPSSCTPAWRCIRIWRRWGYWWRWPTADWQARQEEKKKRWQKTKNFISQMFVWSPSGYQNTFYNHPSVHCKLASLCCKARHQWISSFICLSTRSAAWPPCCPPPLLPLLLLLHVSYLLNLPSAGTQSFTSY